MVLAHNYCTLNIKYGCAKINVPRDYVVLSRLGAINNVTNFELNNFTFMITLKQSFLHDLFTFNSTSRCISLVAVR